MENLKIKLLKYAGHPHQWPWFVLIAAGLLVLIYWIVFRALPWTSDPSAWGSFGDYMGGLLNPAVSTLTLVVAIKVWAQQREELEETKRALKDQAETAQANRREQRFFDLMQVYQQTLDTFQGVSEQSNARQGKAALDIWLDSHIHLEGMIRKSYLRAQSSPGSQNIEDQLDYWIDLAKQHWAKPYVGESLNHYFRVIFRILHEQDRHRFIRIFRAQLSHTELLLLGLNLWITEEGQKMQPIACEYGLLKHLPQCNLRDVLEKDLPPLVFGRRFAEIKASQS